MKDLYKALCKTSMISLKYNRIKSYAKSALSEKKGWNRMSFYKTQQLSETLNFNKIRSANGLYFHNFTLKFINGKWWKQEQAIL